MKVLGIIAEYNPFHNGHQYHLQTSRQQAEADCVVCVMSGDFMQRGEPARWDKWSRAELAVRGGADLVLELPAPFAVNSADQFAYGAIKLLSGLGAVTHLSFGSEVGELAPLTKAAALLADENEGFRAELKRFLAQGLSFPAARQQAADAVLGAELHVLDSPNNILAIEYLKQLMLANSPIIPLTVKRQGEDYHSPRAGQPLSSATAIRQALAADDPQAWVSLPPAAKTVLQAYPKRPVRLEDYFSLLIYRIRTAPLAELAQIYSVSEGLEHKLKKTALTSRSLAELIAKTKSKRYTQTRIQRLLIHTLWGLSHQAYEELVAAEAMYARVLAVNQTGQALLRTLKKEEKSTIPLLTNSNRQTLSDPNRQLLAWDLLASDLYEMMASPDLHSGSDRVKRPFLG